MVAKRLDRGQLQQLLQAITARRETMPEWAREGLQRRISHVTVEIATGYATIYYVDFDNQQTATIGDYLPPELLQELMVREPAEQKEVA